MTEYISLALWLLLSPHYSILIHEGAHIVAALVLGWSVGEVRIGGGPSIRIGGMRLGIKPFRGSIFVLPPGMRGSDMTPTAIECYRTQIAFIAVAGPLANIALGVCAWLVGHPILAAVSVYAACYTLLSGSKGSDGAIIKAYIQGSPIVPSEKGNQK